MPGYKSKSSAPVVVNGIYQLFEVRMVRGTKSFKKGFEQPRRNLVAQGKQQNKKNSRQDTFPARRFVEKHDHEKQQQRHPNVSAGESPEEIIQKDRIATVQSKKKVR